jgi:leucyl aminopeptidase
LSPTDFALGWAFGSYAFTRYKKPKRLPAKLVWPAQADRNEVEHVAEGVFLARDLINTPAEDIGPEQLAGAVLTVAKTGSIIGALYLAEFVSTSTRWAHLDIMVANPAAKRGRPEGGEATGMRALYTYIRQRYA